MTVADCCRPSGSLLLPAGGPSSSHRACVVSTPVRPHIQPGQHGNRQQAILRAQNERSQDPRWRGPPTETYDDNSDRRRAGYDYPPQDYRYERPPPPPEPPTQTGTSPGGGGGGPDSLTRALIGGAFVLGIGVGVWFNSEATFYPSNVASTEIVDRKTPNTEICMANGYSSMVFDQRLFVSFNP